MYINTLVGGLEPWSGLWLSHHIRNISSSQLTFTPSFFRGVGQPPVQYNMIQDCSGDCSHAMSFLWPVPLWRCLLHPHEDVHVFRQLFGLLEVGNTEGPVGPVFPDLAGNHFEVSQNRGPSKPSKIRPFQYGNNQGVLEILHFRKYPIDSVLNPIWLVTWNICYFSIYSHHPNWLSVHHFSEG